MGIVLCLYLFLALVGMRRTVTLTTRTTTETTESEMIRANEAIALAMKVSQDTRSVDNMVSKKKEIRVSD